MARILKKIMFITLTLGIVAASSLWITSWALEPEPYGEAVAPDPDAHPDAIIQVYGADVWGMRGKFAVHTWIATKAKDADAYTIYQVIGWRLRRSGTAVSIAEGNPARPWYGSPPVLLHELRGSEADALIKRVHDAALSYPYSREYTMWPGPNSNSFIAWVGLEVPELNLQLPAKAIGQSWMKSIYPQLKRSET